MPETGIFKGRVSLTEPLDYFIVCLLVAPPIDTPLRLSCHEEEYSLRHPSGWQIQDDRDDQAPLFSAACPQTPVRRLWLWRVSTLLCRMRAYKANNPTVILLHIPAPPMRRQSNVRYYQHSPIHDYIEQSIIKRQSTPWIANERNDGSWKALLVLGNSKSRRIFLDLITLGFFYRTKRGLKLSITTHHLHAT